MLILQSEEEDAGSQWYMQFSPAVQNSKPKLCLIRLNTSDKQSIRT